MKRISLLIACFAVSLFAENWDVMAVPGANNVKYIACRIDSGFAGQTRYTPWFNYGDNEGAVTITLRFNDTTAAGFKNDSVKAYAFIQRGWPSRTLAYAPDTQPNMTPFLIDTIDALTAGNWKTLTIQSANDTTLAKALDSTGTTGFGTLTRDITTYWAPFARIGVVFMTGTKISAAKSVRFSVDVIQRKYIKTDLYPRERPDPQ